jgi:hypothetical protein
MTGEKKGYYELLHKKFERRRLQTLVKDCPNLEASLFKPNPESQQLTNQFNLDS